MGNGNITAANKDQKQKSLRSKNKQSGELLGRKQSTDKLIFYVCTDKAPV